MNRIKNVICSSKFVWAMLIFVLSISFFIMNYMTPYLADDYNYIGHMHWIKENTTIQTLGDVIESAKWFYANLSGRVEGFLFATAFSFLPEYLFDFVNTLGYLLLTALIYLICRGKEHHNLFLYLGIHIVLWFFVPDYGQVMFWMCGSANYMWISISVLTLIYIFRRYACLCGNTMKNPLWGVLTFLVGFIAGWGMENITAGMLVILTLYFLYYHFCLKIKIKISLISGYIGSLLGFACLFFAPGNNSRADMMTEELSGFFKFFIIDYYWIMFLGIPCVLWGIVYVISKSMLEEKIFKMLTMESIIFAVGGFSAAYCLLAAPTIPERTWFIVIIYVLISIGIYFSKIQIHSYPLIYKVVKIIYGGLFIILLTCMADTMLYSREISVQTMARNQYILEQKALGYTDIQTPIIKHQYPLRTQHDALTGLSDIQENPEYWINVAMAKYYGINSITGTTN